MNRERHEQYYEKRVDYVAKDDDEQTATGVVMVPNTVDHQGDWERPETIEAFANQFEAFMDVDEADGGIMHGVWPSEWMTLERNEVLDDATEIGGKTVDAGSWVQSWGYNDDDLWGLVADDILGGHSIGAVTVDWEFNGSEPDDLPDDVTVPDEVDVAKYWELTDGIVQEVSAVDIPAVPDAQILSTSKARAATAEKRLANHLGNRSGFIEEAQERGHSETEAERLWDVLDRAINVDGAGDPGAKSKLTSAATAFLNALTGSETASAVDAPSGEQTAKDAPEGDTSDDTTDMSDDPMEDAPKWAEALHDDIQENSNRIDEAIDADGEAGQNAGDDPFEDAPEWAKSLKEEQDKNAERIDAISKQTGATESQQLGGPEKGGKEEEGLGDRQKFFIPESKRRAAEAQAGGGR
jgi:hypothetical protein